jgi:hypothetical protein
VWAWTIVHKVFYHPDLVGSAGLVVVFMAMTVLPSYLEGGAPLQNRTELLHSILDMYRNSLGCVSKRMNIR